MSKDAELEQGFKELDGAVKDMLGASRTSVTEAEKLARTARAARPSQSNPKMQAVKAPVDGEPLTEEEIPMGDLTSRFQAIRKAL
jgi:hypothetical protein